MDPMTKIDDATHYGAAQASYGVRFVAPGAVQIAVQQVNWPTVPVDLRVDKSGDAFITHTLGLVTDPTGKKHPITKALITYDVLWADGTATHHPAGTVTLGDALHKLNRKGFYIGDPLATQIGSSQTINVNRAMGIPALVPPLAPLDDGVAPESSVSRSYVVMAGAVAVVSAAAWVISRLLRK